MLTQTGGVKGSFLLVPQYLPFGVIASLPRGYQRIDNALPRRFKVIDKKQSDFIEGECEMT